MQLNIARLSSALLGLFAAGCVSASGPAHAGEWRFHPERCPDLVEDVRDRRESRRDERYDHGLRDRAEDRADRRESRRDERVTVCPKTAWVHHGSSKHRSARPAAIVIYYDPYKHQYYRYGSGGARIFIAFR